MNTNEARCDELEKEIVTLSARMTAAEYKFLLCVRELERIVVLHDCTFAQWIAWRCNIEKPTAYERIRVAKALADLPLISEAFEQGRLSYSKARIVTRIATPTTDAFYLRYALSANVRQLEKVVRGHTGVSPDKARLHSEARHFQIVLGDDGMFTVRGKLTADDAMILQKAIQAAESAGAESKADAMVKVATAAIDRLATGDDVYLHVATSPHSCCAADHPCYTVEGEAIAETTAERLLCENPNARHMNKTQRRLLMERHGGCCGYPKCTNVRGLQGHHVIHWSKGGKTTVDNLVLLCEKHHHLLHEGQQSIAREDGKFVYRDSWGRVVKGSGELPVVAPEDRDLATTVPATTDTRGRDVWLGDKLDLDYAIDLVVSIENAAARAQAAKATP